MSTLQMERAMNFKFLTPLTTIAALAFAPTTAHAVTGFTDDSTSLRAGPGRDYPRIARLPRNVRLEVHGCLRRYDWCDVSFRGARGWIDADDVKVAFRNSRGYIREYGTSFDVPLITFSFDWYWDKHYRGQRFYRDRASWRERSRGWYRDQDGDGVPNRYDRDQDGDGIRNSRDRDVDGDGIRNKRDPNPNRPN
ncbi:MAG: SH3 domain-containing protein [Rhodospirillaceae bacterium]|nr:SH3 domain-containing protein [Rhodospirillaceae bacterium]